LIWQIFFKEKINILIKGCTKNQTHSVVTGTGGTIEEQTAVMEEIASMADGFSSMATELEKLSNPFCLNNERKSQQPGDFQADPESEDISLSEAASSL